VRDILEKLDKVFENRIRLGIMSLLMVHTQMDFVTLKKSLTSSNRKKVSDGNLASHLKTLYAQEYIEEQKKFVNRKPQTIYRVSKKGRAAFEQHLQALEDLIKDIEQKT